MVQLDRGYSNDLRSRFRRGTRLHSKAIEPGHLMRHAIEILDFETQNGIVLRDVRILRQNTWICVQRM